MKVKMLTRNPDIYLRETAKDIHKVPRNFDPSLHPLEVPREYVKALNATKLERVFAKPFVGNLDGHKEGVSCLSKHPKRLSVLLSGAYDGEVKLWNLARRECIRSIQAHEGYVRGSAFLPDGEHFVTIGDDKSIKIWETDPTNEDDITPTDTAVSKTIISCISHHQKDPLFATCGEICQIWEETRSEPIRTFKWGVDSLYDVAYNPVETDVLATCASDRSIILYDSRDTGPVRKVKMKLRINKVCWNPMEAFVITGASEDYNLYTFDVRRFDRPMNVHMDHVSAVTHLDYSPTGKEFVTGSYDKSIRIFEVRKYMRLRFSVHKVLRFRKKYCLGENPDGHSRTKKKKTLLSFDSEDGPTESNMQPIAGHSRDIYHTKRMQRLTAVAWTLDDKYILSGSDEMNIRIWKARAAEKLGVLRPREKLALEYNETLKAKFAAHPQVSRISRHRQVPKHIYNAKKQLKVARDKIKRKEANRRKHSKPGSVPFVPERKRHVLGEEE